MIEGAKRGRTMFCRYGTIKKMLIWPARESTKVGRNDGDGDDDEHSFAVEVAMTTGRATATSARAARAPMTTPYRSSSSTPFLKLHLT